MKSDPINDFQDYVQGYVLIPFLLTAKKINIFQHLQKCPASLSELAILCQAKDGILQVVLQVLESLKLVRKVSGVFELEKNPELVVQIDQIQINVLETYQIDMHEYMQIEGIDFYKSWIERIQTISESEHVDLSIKNYLEGVIVVPFLVHIAQAKRQNHIESTVDSINVTNLSNRFINNLSLIFHSKNWGVLECNAGTQSIKLTKTGQWFLDHAMSYGVAASYRKLLFHLPELLIGQQQEIFEMNDGIEGHVDRALNVQGSGSMHSGFFEAMAKQIANLFQNQNSASRPSYVIDTGCGDGSLLAKIYKAIQLMRHDPNTNAWPIKMIGIDFNKAALEETIKTMEKEEVPFLVDFGDVGDPQGIQETLKQRGIDSSKAVHIRSFLDHDRPFIQPDRSYNFSPKGYCGIFSATDGRLISTGDFLQHLEDHFYRWANAIDIGGHLVTLEVHSMPPNEAYKYRFESISLYFDPIQFVSGQLLTTVRQYHLAAAVNGFFPAINPQSLILFPKKREFQRISLTHFERLDAKVDYLAKYDADSLYCKLSIEKYISKVAISKLIQKFPEGQLLFLDKNQQILGGVLTLTAEEILQIPELANSFQIRNSYTAIVIPFDFKNSGLNSEYLKSFAWLQALLLPEIQKVQEYRLTKGQEIVDPFHWEFVHHHLVPDSNWNINEFSMILETTSLTNQYEKHRNLLDLILAEIRRFSLDFEGDIADMSVLELQLSSLDMIYLARRLQSQLQVEIPSTVFFSYPTPRALAKFLESTSIKKTMKRSISEVEPENALYKLSYNQEQMWVWFKIYGHTAAYNVPRVEYLDGKIDRFAFEEAFCQILDRHIILRTRFVEENGVPMQKVVEIDRHTLPIIWKVCINDTMTMTDIKKLVDEEINKPFDLVNESPIRILGILLPNDLNVIIISMHHIVTDGTSTTHFWNEMLILYQSAVIGILLPLPELSWNYFQWAKWHKRMLQSGIMKQELDYWSNVLEEGNVPYLKLPTDFPYPDLSDCPGDRILIRLSTETTRQFKRICASEKATLFMGLTSAWYVLLMRLSGQHDFAIGTPWVNRNRKEIENNIGCFVNTVPLRIQTKDDITFTELLQKVKIVAHDAFKNGNVPFHKVIEGLKFQRSTTQLPIYQTMVALEEEGGWIKGESLFGTSRKFDSSIRAKRHTSKFEISISLREITTENGTCIDGELVYNTLIFSRETAERMKRQFEILMRNIAETPDDFIFQFSINDELSMNKLLEWSNIDRTELFPDNLTVYDLFYAQAKESPNGIAIRSKSDSWTYEKLLNLVLNICKQLADANIENQKIGLYLGRSHYIIASVLAVMGSGNVYVPLDLNFPAERLRFICTDANVQVIITDQSEDTWMFGLKIFHTTEFSSCSTTFIGPKVATNSTAYILYTSGTSGKPKGVMISHVSLTNDVWFLAKKQISHEQLCQTLFSTNLCFDQSVEEMFPGLISGNTVVLAEHILDHYWFDQGVTLVITTPSSIRLLCSYGIPSSVKACVLGGEALNIELVTQIFNESNIEVIYNSYGPTECTDQALVSSIRKDELLTKINCGRPIDNIMAILLDEHQNLSPLGAWGELYIGGIGVGQGYINRDDLTKKCFLSNPFGIGRLYRTGDYFRWTSAGNLEFKGRIDDQIKIHGIRIELDEIETCIRGLSNVENCCVKIRSDEFGEKRIIAFVVGPKLMADEVLKYCEKALPVYMVPYQVVLVDQFKLTLSGKIDSFALPDISKSVTYEICEHPQNPEELAILNLFKEVLKTDKVSPTSNFFCLGGHSLLTIMVVSKIKDLFHVDVSMREFMTNSSTRELAKLINKKAIQERNINKYSIEVDYNQIPESGKNILIIGAGIAGLMAAIELKKRGIYFTLVEKSSTSGGIWLNGCNPQSRLQTSSEFYVVDKSIQHKHLYPNRQQMLDYLNEIANFHNLQESILFNTEVLNVTDSGNGFHIKVRCKLEEKILNHDGILVCTGKHHVPYIPRWRMTSANTPLIVHASKLAGINLQGKKVTVIGGGSYAIEAIRIAATEGAACINMVARAFHWVLPTFADTIINSCIDFQSMVLSLNYKEITALLTEWLEKFYIQHHLEQIIPSHENKSFDATVSTSNEFFEIAQNTSVTFFRSIISEISTNSVILENGKTLSTDVLIAATGYQDPNFDFLRGICQKPVVYKGFMLAQDPRITLAGFLDMVGSATAVLPVNFNAALAVMTNKNYRPPVDKVTEWLNSMPDNIITNVKSHVSWIVEMQLPNEFIQMSENTENTTKNSNYSSVVDQFIAIASKFPNRTALIDGDRSITYQELAHLTNQVQSYYATTTSKQLVFFLPQSATLVAAVLAGLQSSKFILFIPFFGLSQFEQCRKEFDRAALITCREGLNLISEKCPDLISLFVNILMLDEMNSSFESYENKRSTVDTNCTEIGFLTSGTTGSSKVVIHTIYSLSMCVANFVETAKPSDKDRLLLVNEVTHMGGFMGCFSMLINGNTVVLERGFHLDTFDQIVHKYEPTHILLMSSLFELWYIAHYEFQSLPEYLNCIIIGGDRVTSSITEAVSIYPKKKFVVTYGLSECGATLTTKLTPNSSSEILGYPVKGVKCEIRGENLKSLSSNLIGKLWVKSESNFKGYYSNYSVSGCENGWFNTGDLVGYSDKEGYFFYGRETNCLVDKSVIISTTEIETLLNSMNGVKKALVLKTHSFFDICLEIKPNSNPNEVLRMCRQKLLLKIDYNLIGGLTTISDVRRLSTGKVDYKQLRNITNNLQNIVILFPGQGIQHIGMADNILKLYPSSRDLFNTAAAITGIDLLTLCQNGPQEVLNQTLICQLVIFVTSMAYFYYEIAEKSLAENRIAYFAGLSLGEYTTLCASGVLKFEDALHLIYLRGKAMQEASQAVPQAMITMLGTTLADVQNLVNDFAKKGSIYLANYLSDDSFVIAGDAEICQEAQAAAAKYGIKRAIKLNVTGAFHTPFMASCQNSLVQRILETPFSKPSAPVICNFTGEPTDDVEELKHQLIQQLTNPVRWDKIVKLLKAKEDEIGILRYVELGPSMILTKLLRQ